MKLLFWKKKKKGSCLRVPFFFFFSAQTVDCPSIENKINHMFSLPGKILELLVGTAQVNHHNSELTLPFHPLCIF